MTTRAFDCALCGGTVYHNAESGRTWQLYADAPLYHVPPELDIPKCKSCGEEYLSVSNEDALYAALEEQHKAWVAGNASLGMVWRG